MKARGVDRLFVFLFVAVISFLYDFTYYLGIRDTTRFPHPFVFFRSLGDVAYLRGFPGMLRQAMFSLIAGGLLGWVASFIILKCDWLAQATIRFLRIAIWFPFIVVFAFPETRTLGIFVAMLAGVYHYLTARVFLELPLKDAFRRAVGDVALQVLLFTLLAQIWDRRWEWAIFPMTWNGAAGVAVQAAILCIVVLLNWIFRKRFQTECEFRAAIYMKEFLGSTQCSFVGVMLLATAWLLLWELACIGIGFDSARPLLAIQRIPETLMNGDAWHDIQISTLEIAGGILLGAPLALLASLLLSKSRDIHPIVDAILPATYLSPIALWLLVFLLVSPTSGFYMGVGQKTVAAGFLTFFPILRALRAFHDATLLQRWALAVDDALPIAFVGILFAELYAATAGLGFWMTVASATQQYQQGLAGFFVTAALFTGISIFLRATARH